MYEKAHIQTTAVDSSRRREQEPFISRMFITLNVLNCKKARQSDQSVSCSSSSLVTSWVWSSNKTVAGARRIVNSCVGQAVVVIIIIASIKCEHWHISNANNKGF